MNEIEWMIMQECNRRAKAFVSMIPVPFNLRIVFGVVADNQALLAAVANSFYFIESAQSSVTLLAGVPIIETTGQAGYVSSGVVSNYNGAFAGRRMIFDSMTFRTNGWTAGLINIYGIAYRITHTA